MPQIFANIINTLEWKIPQKIYNLPLWPQAETEARNIPELFKKIACVIKSFPTKKISDAETSLVKSTKPLEYKQNLLIHYSKTEVERSLQINMTPSYPLPGPNLSKHDRKRRK